MVLIKKDFCAQKSKKVLSEQEKRLIAKYGMTRVQYRNLQDGHLIYDVNPSNLNGKESPSLFLTRQIQRRVLILLQEGFGRTLVDITSEDVKLWSSGTISQIGPLFLWAATTGNFDLLQACHETESDVINYNLFDTLPKYSNTCKPRINALHLAALSGSHLCVQHLLNKGCDYISEFKSNSKEWSVIESNLLPFMRFDKAIMSFIDQFSPAHLAVLGNHVHILNKFTRGIGDDSDWFPRTCLHAALLSDAMGCLKYLIQEQILLPAEAYNLNGMTVFHLAAAEGDILALNLITSVIEKGPKPVDWITHDKERKSALHIAAQRGQESTVRYLIIEADADPTMKDSLGRSAIHYIRSHCLGIDPSEIIHQRLDSTLDFSENELSIHLGYLLKHSSSVGGDLSFLKTLHEENVNLLQHPSSLALLESKWKYLRPCLYVQAVMNILGVFLTSLTILQTFHLECRSTSIAQNNLNYYAEFQSPLFTVAYVIYYILLVVNLLPIIIFMKGYNSLKEFIFNKHNILQIFFMIGSLLFFHFSFSCYMRRCFGALTIIIGCYMVSSFIDQLSGSFIAKCMTVSINILKATILIIAFLFVLRVASSRFGALGSDIFENLFLGQMKILEMVVGKMDWDQVWRDHPSITILICIFFILFVIISSMGPLSSLTEDKQELQKKVEIAKIAWKMRSINFYEKVCRRKIYLPLYPICLSDILFVSKNFLFEPDKKIRVHLDDPSRSSEELPQDIIDAAIKIRMPQLCAKTIEAKRSRVNLIKGSAGRYFTSRLLQLLLNTVDLFWLYLFVVRNGVDINYIRRKINTVTAIILMFAGKLNWYFISIRCLLFLYNMYLGIYINLFIFKLIYSYIFKVHHT